MSRCRIGPKKLKRKIAPLVPVGMTINGALVRGGWEHGYAKVMVTLADGSRAAGAVNYLTSESFEIHPGGEAWRISPEESIPGCLVV